MTGQLLIFISAAICLSVGCLVPSRCLPVPLPNDKLMHFLAFGGLALLALSMARDQTEAAWWLFGLLVGGWLIECAQQLVPDRSFCWRDLAANAAGIASAALCALVLQALGVGEWSL